MKRYWRLIVADFVVDDGNDDVITNQEADISKFYFCQKPRI